MSGPLTGLRVIEFAGLGPAPFCAMLLADCGAEVVRIDRPGAEDPLGQRRDPLTRGRRSLALDLKRPEAVAAALRLIDGADALIEGFRPGVMERLGLGPDLCLARNPRLVYGRMTGWGQTGPLAERAGHDITYTALSGALHAIGPAGAPVVPLNLVADLGGGGMVLAFGLVAALWEASRSGRGQVIDAAMTDGAALMMAMVYGLKGNGLWSGARTDNLIDGGYPFYGTYRCADGKWLAIGPLEERFLRLFLDRIGLDDPALAPPIAKADWPAARDRLAAWLATRPRGEWLERVEGSDACVAPVLDLDEAPLHPHNRARGSFVEQDGMVMPAPAPRFSRTPARAGAPPGDPGGDGSAVLAEAGFSAAEIERLLGAASA
ncbi:CaiB/BaiF CoA transferase family protein [Phaeospirillum tilakii]|uniref:CaiB/BaiF CoA transferase family protein n=1 Tax=Phaeospirillum tilakii TaxID=741673 RepID=A0ABW5CCE9_9PROT